MGKLKQFLGLLVGGLSIVLFSLLGIEKKKNRYKDSQIAEQKQELIQKELAVQTTEMIRREEESLRDVWYETEQTHSKEQSLIEVAETKGESNEAIHIANDIVTRFNDRHQL